MLTKHLTQKLSLPTQSLSRLLELLGCKKSKCTFTMTTPTYKELQNVASKVFSAAVQSVQPSTIIKNCLKFNGNTLTIAGKEFLLKKPCFVTGFGKAALGMATETENILGEKMATGIVSVPYGTQRIFQAPSESRLKIFEGARNNLPDEDAVATASMILEMAQGLKADDLLLVLISGGGSALLPLPCPPITLHEKLQAIKLLTSAGADIQQLNCVRKRLSLVKGGQLAKAALPATTVSLILSDVISDPIDIIASGPTVPNQDSDTAPMDILSHFNLQSKIPEAVHKTLLTRYKTQECDEFHIHNFVVGNNSMAIAEAVNQARDNGYATVQLSKSIEGNVVDVAKFYAQLAESVSLILRTGDSINTLQRLLGKSSHLSLFSSFQHDLEEALHAMPQRKGLCLIAGGETTVHVIGKGLGGRNQELALRFAEELQCLKKNGTHLDNFSIGLLSAGTDGIDGPTSASGAFGYAEQVQNSPNYKEYLNNNDTHTFYRKYCGGENLMETGHTGTNVMDLHILLIQMN